MENLQYALHYIETHYEPKDADRLSSLPAIRDFALIRPQSHQVLRMTIDKLANQLEIEKIS